MKCKHCNKPIQRAHSAYLDNDWIHTDFTVDEETGEGYYGCDVNTAGLELDQDYVVAEPA